MNKMQAQVEEFHTVFEILKEAKPTIPDEATKTLRVALIEEEFLELIEAYKADDLVGIADGLCDLIYVVLGAAVSHGLDLEPLFDEVHRSNMSKVGGHKREDGKWVKPDTYSPADLASIIAAQG